MSKNLWKVLENCSTSLVDNKLSLHLGKTECVLFGPTRKLKSIHKFVVVCNNYVIKSTDSVKYLGLKIDKFLDCERIFLSIVQKVNTRLKFLYRHANVPNTQSRITLTPALIQCQFDYSCFSWFGSIRKTL